MKKIILLIFVTFIFTTTFAQTTWDFTHAIQTTEASAQWTDEWIQEMITDNAGNVYVVGTTSATEIEIGGVSHTGQGNMDVFLLKADNAGNIVWAKFLGSDESEIIKGLAYDNENNKLYATGSTGSSNLDFGNDVVLTNPGAFLVKFDVDGNAEWVKTASSDNGCEFSDVALNSEQKPIIVGNFTGDNLYIESQTISNTESANNYNDLIIAKYDTEGNLETITTTETSAGSEDCDGIEIDDNDNIFIAGQYSNEFGFGNVSFSEDVEGNQLFIIKFDADMEAQWGVTATNDGYCSIYDAFKCDGENVYAHFSYQGSSIEFGGETYTNDNPEPDSEREALFTKIDNDGNIVYVVEIEGEQAVNVTGTGFGGIDVTQNGEAIICGAFYSPIINFGEFTLTNTSTIMGYSGYIVKLDQGGTPIFADMIGNEYFASGVEVAFDHDEKLMVAGIYLMGDLTIGDITLSNTGSWDSFFAKLSGLPNSYITTFEVIAGINPIENAEITVGETTKQTNENGIAEFYFLPNDYEYSVQATNYENIENVSFSITDQNETITIQMNSLTAIAKNGLEINIFPNPTTGILNLSGFQSTDAMLCVSTVKITDITGKQIQNIQYSTQNNQYSLDLSDLENGIYFIKIEKEGNIYTKKIVKY